MTKSTIPFELNNDHTRELCRARLYNDKDKIVAYLKTTDDAVTSVKIAEALGMKAQRPSFVATNFPMTLASWPAYKGGKKVSYVDLHPHLRRRAI